MKIVTLCGSLKFQKEELGKEIIYYTDLMKNN